MEIFWTVVYGFLVLLTLKRLYRYLTKPFDYWKDRGVPSVPAIPFIGSLYDTFTKELHEVLLDRYKKYGRVYGSYESSKPVLSIADPELLKDILVKDFQFFSNRRDVTSADSMLDYMVSNMRGEEWKRVRTIITPAFSSGKIKKMSSLILEASKVTLKNFEKHGEGGKAVDCKKIFGAFAMDVIARSAFGTILDSHNDPENVFIQRARLAFSSGRSLSIILFVLFPKVYKLLKRSIFPTEATDFFRDLTLGIIKQRRATGQRQNDFLQLLMDEADEVRSQKNSSTVNEETTLEDDSEKSINDLGHDQENKKVFQITKKYKGLSKDELVAQCVIFFLAGYETTASTLSFASYLLAVNPECQEILIKEIDDVLRKNQNKLTYEAVQSMKYLENVVWETLRIFPPLLTERKTEEDYDLGETGIKIPKGMIVSVPIYPIHHDPEFYEDPEKFDPNRFTQEEKCRRNPYSFIPFGAGPRNCIGMRFALIEIKLCLATLLSQCRFMKCPETKVPLEFLKGQVQGILRPKSNLLRIERRTDCVK